MQSRVNSSESLVPNTDYSVSVQTRTVASIYFILCPFQDAHFCYFFLFPSLGWFCLRRHVHVHSHSQKQQRIGESKKKTNVIYDLSSQQISTLLLACLIKLNSDNILSGSKQITIQPTLTRVLIVYGNSFQSILSASSQPILCNIDIKPIHSK